MSGFILKVSAGSSVWCYGSDCVRTERRLQRENVAFTARRENPEQRPRPRKVPKSRKTATVREKCSRGFKFNLSRLELKHSGLKSPTFVEYFSPEESLPAPRSFSRSGSEKIRRTESLKRRRTGGGGEQEEEESRR